MKITYGMLESQDRQWSNLKVYKEKFPDNLELTYEHVKEMIADGYDMHWFASRFLIPMACEFFRNIEKLIIWKCLEISREVEDVRLNEITRGKLVNEAKYREISQAIRDAYVKATALALWSAIQMQEEELQQGKQSGGKS